MTTEEKARRYNEALDRAKAWVENRCMPFDTNRQGVLEDIFPELKVSEDELTWLTKYIEEEAYSLSIDIRDNEDRIKLKKLQKALTWLEKQGTERKQLYIRFGDIPSNEKSKIYREEEEIGDENGVSVYPAFELNGNIVLGLTLPITKTTLYTQQHLLEYDNRPCYLVSGDYVGKGTDGESLIRNISIIKRLYNYRIKEIEKRGEQKLQIEKLTSEMKTIEESLGLTTQEECDKYNQMVSDLIMSDDKIVPKFKIGDTITYIGERKELLVDNKYTIKEISKNCYISTLGNKIPFSMQEYYTIINDPKFKVGDWLTNSIETVQITGYDIDYGYQVDYKGNLQHRDTDIIEKEYHLWTIQDAKDGDVLAGSKGDVILMFRGIGNTEWDDVIDYHCYYDCYRECFVVQEDVEYWGNIKNNQLKPATKEQRDLLFEKMDKAGYMLVEGNKELKLLITNDGNFEPCDEKQNRHKVWTYNDYDKIKSIEYLLHELDNHNFDDWFNHVLNNDECKPIVVKKFSEGDWIVKKGHVYGGVPVMIKEIGNYLYLCERQDGVIIELNKDCVLKEYKHWDITDAVNGNVLVYNKTKSPFIYDGKIKNYDTGNPKDIFIGAHCGIYGKGEFIINHVEYWIDNNVQPATKEQRDLLFSKMEEAGYEWDWWKKRCIKK